MNIAIFGGFGKRPLPPGWKRETALVALGSGELDISDVPPAEGAKLTVVAIFGSARIVVSPGTKVRMQGFSIFGGRESSVAHGEGPEVNVNAIAIFGGVRIKEK